MQNTSCLMYYYTEGLRAPSQKTNLLGGVAQILIIGDLHRRTSPIHTTLIPLEGLGAPSQKTSLLGGVTQILINPRPSPHLADVGLFVRPKSQHIHQVMRENEIIRAWIHQQNL